MRRDWRGPSSSSTISKVRLGFMSWFEARSARTGVSKWIAAGILKQFSVTPATASYSRRENPDDRFHQHNRFSSYKSCSIAQEQRLGTLPGRFQSGVHIRLPSRVIQEMRERGEECFHVCLARRFAHQTDAPDVALERTEAGANFDVEIGEQTFAHGSFVDPAGHGHRIELPELVTFLRRDREADCLQAGFKREMILLVATPAPVRVDSSNISACHCKRRPPAIHQSSPDIRQAR